MDDANVFWENNYCIAIYPNGKIESIPSIEGEKNHSEIYDRMNKKLNGILEQIEETKTSLNSPNLLAKMGFINIFPFYVGEFDDFIVIFPYKPTKEQLKSLENLYEYLLKKCIYYFEKPHSGPKLDYKILQKGFDDLKKYMKVLELELEREKKGREQ